MSPKLPARSDGPNEVRAYIARVLISELDTTSDYANKTSNLWGPGRGSELRDLSVRDFKATFGDYMGWVLFRIVHEDELEDWKRSTAGMISFCKCSCSSQMTRQIADLLIIILSS